MKESKVKRKRKMKSEDLTGKVMDLGAMVEYHTGSVVSRTVIDKPAGTLTLFAFDKGQGLSEHTAPYDALVYMLDGEAEVKIAGKPFHLKQGETIIMPANQPHALRAAARFKMFLAMIKS
jgi:quercetin dioxygenase-like cupin family protein